MNWAEWIGAILASSAIAALLTGLFNRRKVAAESRALDGEALNKAAQGYATLITALTQQQNETNRQVAEMMKRLTETEREIHSLREENINLMARLTEAEREICNLREENTTLRQETARLQALLLEVGIDPYTGECVGRGVNL